VIRRDRAVAKIASEPAIERRDGCSDSVPILLRIDTPFETVYCLAGGIMPYVLEQLLAEA
jgi:aconitate hydratase